MNLLKPLTRWPACTPKFKPFATLLREQFDLQAEPSDDEVRRAIRTVPKHYGRFSAAFQDVLFSNQSSTEYTAFTGSTTTETTLLTGGEQYCFPAFFFDQARRKQRIRINLAGIVSFNAAYTFQLRLYLYTAAGSTAYGSMSKIAGNISTLTSIGSVSNAHWEARVEILCQQPGGGTGATTLSCRGFIKSPAGFAAPYEYGMGPDSMATSNIWTTTLDGGSPQYLYVTATFGTGNASNSIRLMEQYIESPN